MKKRIVLLPLLMLVLAACNPPTTSSPTSDTSSEPVSSSEEGMPMSTIGQILAEATVGKMYKTRGTVVHLNGGQVFLQDDENKSINAYVGGDATAPLLVGNVIEVLGTYKLSNMAAQLETALVEAVVSQVDDSPIVPLVIEDAATLATLTSADYSESGRLVRLNGVTTTSYDPDTKKFTLSLGASSVVAYAGFSAAHEDLGENRPAIQALINNISLAGVEFDIMGALFSATGAGVWNLGLPTVNYIVAPELPDRFLASIAVTTEPTDKDYTAGQNFDPAGMVVTATYDDATTAVVTPLCTYSPSPLTQGLTEVTVSYKEGTITKTTTVTGIVVVAPQAAQDEVTINKAIPAGWTYISNNPESYPDPAFYNAGQLKINFVGMGIQSPVLDGAYHKVTIGGVLNTNTKTDGKATTLDLVVNGQMVDDWEASGTPFSGVELNFPNGFTQFSIIMSGNVGYNVGLGTILVS